jgi:GrpE
MTGGMYRTAALLVAVVVCAAGGWSAFQLSLGMPPPPSDAHQVIATIPQSLGPDVRTALESRLPTDASALALQVRERQEAPADARGSGQPSASPQEPAPSAPPPVVWSGRTLIVYNRDDYDAERARLQATSNVADRPSPGGTSLTIATPRADRSTGNAVAVAIVAALTGVVAATAVALLWRPGRRGSTGVPADNPARGNGQRPAVPDAVPVHAGAGLPTGAGGRPPVPPGVVARPQAPPGPRGLPVVPAPGAGGPTAGPTGAVASLDTAPPDPQLSALRTQRTTLIRGLADLAAKLPAEYGWQAANVLDAAGARRIVPDGDAFDPARHHAVDTEPPPDARLDDTVARTLRPGWADGSQVVVPARVVVYALPPRRPEGPDDVAH